MCPSVYIEQTDRPFSTTFKEQSNALKQNSGQSKFADHILEENHSFACVENIMSITSTIQKGKYLGTVENFHI